MDVVNKRLSDLKPYENNPRHNRKSVDMVAKSIEQFGFLVPLVITSSGEIVCGHTRHKAAKKLKMESVPCVIADTLTDEQIKAFRIADNRAGEYSTWDIEALAGELATIGESVDMSEYSLGDYIDGFITHESKSGSYESLIESRSKANRGNIIVKLGDYTEYVEPGLFATWMKAIEEGGGLLEWLKNTLY